MSASTSAAKLTNKEVEKLIKEGKTLVTHHGKTPPYTKPKQGTAAGKQTRETAIAEADQMKLAGAIRTLFIKERMEGWIAAGQFENVTEQGLMDELITPLTLGLAHGPGAGKTKYSTNEKTGKLEVHPEASAVETVEKAVPSIGGYITELIEDYGLRLGEILAGGALILFGLITIAKGSAPSPTKAAKAAALL